MKLPRQVYEIKHNVTNRSYIGSSANVKQRIYNHFKLLRSNSHPVEDMQTDFLEYGEDYTVRILDEITSWEERFKEYHWMRKYNSCIRGLGYNYKDNAKVQLGTSEGRSEVKKKYITEINNQLKQCEDEALLDLILKLLLKS